MRAFLQIVLRANEPKEISNLITEALTLYKPVIIDMTVKRVGRPKIFSGRAPWMSPQEDLIK